MRTGGQTSLTISSSQCIYVWLYMCQCMYVMYHVCIYVSPFTSLSKAPICCSLTDLQGCDLKRDWLAAGFNGLSYLLLWVQVIAKGFLFGRHAYLKSGWNIMDGSLVVVSIIDIIISLTASHSRHIFGILRVFRLLRTLRPLRCGYFWYYSQDDDVCLVNVVTVLFVQTDRKQYVYNHIIWWIAVSYSSEMWCASNAAVSHLFASM